MKDMREYYFADYRMLIDGDIAGHESMQFLDGFRTAMPYTHTYTVRSGDAAELDARFAEVTQYPELCNMEMFTIHKLSDGYGFAMNFRGRRGGETKSLVISSSDYSEMTVYFREQKKRNKVRFIEPCFTFSSLFRCGCQSGMALREGISLHASLVEKDGWGVVFLGPSGMGKSTQARLWQSEFGADFVNGDRPGFRYIDGVWYGYGMPWDGKDGIRRQKKVPIKAMVSLQQTPENTIRRLDAVETLHLLLRQASLPMWDDSAMECLVPLMDAMSSEVPFYHLCNRADKECADLTYNTLFA